MNEILTVNSDTQTVSARELHERLNIGTPYHKWFPRMCEYGFENERDFNVLINERVQIEGSRKVKREITDYVISVDMAKQICMLQRTEKGRQYRQYFLDLEKAWNTPEQIFARALKMADRTIESLKSENANLLADVNRMRPKEIFADAVATSSQSILIGNLAKLICQNGVDIGQNRLFEWMYENGYLIKSGSRHRMPTQKAMNLGLFEVKERVVDNPDGSTKLTRTTKVTGKGQQYFINKFLAKDGQMKLELE